MLIMRNLNLISVQSWTYLSKIYDENLVAVYMKIKKLKLNRSSNVGIYNLDLSKRLMRNFHYNYIKKIR